MPALPTAQQSDWDNNVYVLATTRIFVMIGLAYLIRSLYSLVPSIWGTRSASVAAVVTDGIDLEAIISDIPVMVPGAAGTGPDLEADLTPEIRPAQPSYDPQNHAERSRVNTRAQNERTEVLVSSTASHAMPEQDVGIRNGDHRIERGVDVEVDIMG